MGSTLTIIFLILYAAVHVLTAMAKKAAERKERERLRMEMERRRGQAGVVEPVPQKIQASADPIWGQPGGPANPLPTPIRTGRPVDDLAARRKQQLEQLRLRREAGKPAGRPTAAQAGTPPISRGEISRPELDPMAQAEVQRRTREQAEARRVREAQDTRRREEEKRARREKSRQEQTKREQAKLPAPVREPQRVTARTSQTAGATPQRSQAPTARTGAVEPRVLRSRMHDRVALRELFILKELIDPPLSIRAERVG